MRERLCTAGFAAVLCLPPAVAADEPLYVKNLSPVTGLFGLPSQRDADSPGAGQLLLALHGSLANGYINEFRLPEAVNLDGEILRLAPQVRYGLAQNWDLQLEASWLQHSGGVLDSLIDGWHDFLGTADGGRPAVARDLLDYRYRGPEAAFFLTDDVSGLGDISLSLNHVFFRGRDTAASLALGYKFGSGEVEDFLGSGGDDAYIALRFSGAHGSGLPLTWHGQAGYLRAGESDLLGDIQNRNLWFAGLALDWAAWERISLLAQLDGHAAPTDSDLTALGKDAWMLSLGLRWRIASRWTMDFSFVEDVQVETAPDITFQASLRYDPG